MPVILPIWKAKDRRIVVKGQRIQKKVSETLSQKQIRYGVSQLMNLPSKHGAQRSKLQYYQNPQIYIYLNPE
jgi:hypothetical protein